MSEDCHESNNPRPVVDKSVNSAQHPATAQKSDVPDDYDPGYLNDFGCVSVFSWWFDYIRAEIGRCNDHWREQWPVAQELDACGFCGKDQAAHIRCPDCGYSECDKIVHGDHHLCPKHGLVEPPAPDVVYRTGGEFPVEKLGDYVLPDYQAIDFRAIEAKGYTVTITKEIA